MALRTHWKVRPYFLTGGRARTRRPLLVHTLVSVSRYDMVFAASLTREARSLYDSARTTSSVAELSARCDLPLGVTRVVIDDLAANDRMTIHDSQTGPDWNTLERLRAGLLRKLA
jgi:hypothetical protein